MALSGKSGDLTRHERTNSDRQERAPKMKIKTRLRGGPSEMARLQHMKIKTKLRGGPSELGG